MAEQSAISWTDGTSSARKRVSPKGGLMRETMATLAQRHAISQIKPKYRVGRKMTDVVSIEIAAAIITAMGAPKPVAKHNIITPSFQFWGEAKPVPHMAVAVNISRCISPARCPLSGVLTYFRSRLKRVSLSKAITGMAFRGRTHFGTAFGRHFIPFTHEASNG